MIGGGLFLLGKATSRFMIGSRRGGGSWDASRRSLLAAVIVQIMLLDIVFSLDSVITAVGAAEDLSIMVTAVVLAVGIMMFSAEPSTCS